MNHFTDRRGYNAIRAASRWRFRAHRQRGGQPFGGYFTTLEPSAPNFFRKVRLPVKKQRFVFRFVNVGDLLPFPGQRGRYIFYPPTDYFVPPPRQLYAGPA
jgi:hypothetical protein